MSAGTFSIAGISEGTEKDSHKTVYLPRPKLKLRESLAAPIHDFPIRDEILHQFVPELRGLNILEIGPGSGFTAYGLIPSVESVTLVDFAEVTVNDLREKLASRGRVRCVRADMCDADFRIVISHKYDLIFGLDVFEYAKNPRSSLRNLCQTLETDGVLFLTFPNQPPERGDGVTRFRTLKELEDLLTVAGFSKWEILSVSLKKYAQLIYTAFHEWPLRVYRSFRSSQKSRPQTYEATWAFRNRAALARKRYVLNAYWLLVSVFLRSGGDAFKSVKCPGEPLGHQLVVRAFK